MTIKMESLVDIHFIIHMLQELSKIGLKMGLL
ncbi:Uncharacterised protein [Vibrio cholerae]|nr:Uncharacterised protein [Vibrio cholerae]